MGLGSFDASQFAPKQGGQIHPVGIFDFVITDTKIVSTGVTKDNPDGTGGSFNVDLTSPSGTFIQRYNLWNENAKTVEIAHGQLSALCHVTGVMRLNFEGPREQAGASLRNTRGKMEIVQQIDKDTKQPTQYVQLARVMDSHGNEPGKAPVSGQQNVGFQPAANNQPMQQSPNGGWQQPNQPTQQEAPQTGWNNNQQAAPQQQSTQPPANQWQPGGAGAAPKDPPWGR